MCQAVNHQIYTDDDDIEDDDDDDDDDGGVAGTYRPEARALEETMARSEGGRNNEVMLISVQTFNFVIWPESLLRHATKHHLLPELPSSPRGEIWRKMIKAIQSRKPSLK